MALSVGLPLPLREFLAFMHNVGEGVNAFQDFFLVIIGQLFQVTELVPVAGEHVFVLVLKLLGLRRC